MSLILLQFGKVQIYHLRTFFVQYVTHQQTISNSRKKHSTMWKRIYAELFFLPFFSGRRADRIFERSKTSKTNKKI